MAALLQKLRNDRGSVLMFIGIGLPALIAVLAIVVDVGNWFVHHRSLQNEVDAAALAGGEAWGYCFNGAGTSALYAEASKYDGGLYNPQIGGSVKGTLGVFFNSTVYPPDPPPSAAPDDTPPDPCTADNLRYVFDVKATEKDVPLIFGGLIPMIGPDLHATARVELRQVDALHGILPLGVPDVRPKFVFAQFVNEDDPNKAPLTDWIALSKNAVVNGQQFWTAPATPVNIASRNVGVRLRLVGGSNSAAACGQTLVECYDNSPDTTSANGLVHIRGWNGAASAPTVHNAWLLSGTCSPDAYFAVSTCSGGLQAEVDLGSDHPLSGNGASAQVLAAVDGSGNIPLTQGSGSGTVTWTLNQGLPFDSTGPHTVALSWTWKQTAGTWKTKTCTTKNSNPCVDSGALGTVQRAFVSDPTRSGPVQRLEIGQPAVGSTAGANSFQQGSTPNLNITLATIGSYEVQAADANAPLITLRVAGGSLTQSIDCDPAVSTLRDEIKLGCGPGYIADDDAKPCPDYNSLWNTPQPWYCVKVQTGGAVGQVDQGLNDRIQLGRRSCTDDNAWPNYPTTDRRIVPLFLTPFGSFSGNGNTTVPVTGFGAFYITGYSGDPCPNATPNVGSGFMVGHFIKYVDQDPGSVPSQKFCDISSLTPCIPVLVK